MKLALVSSLFFALIAAMPAQDRITEVHPENAKLVEHLVHAEELLAEEAPAFLDASPAKGRGGHAGPRQCVRRYASESSSSADSCDCCDQCSKIYYDWLDFYTSVPTFYVDPTDVGTWSYFNLTAPAFIANDGNLTTGCSGGVLNSQVFTSFLPNEGPNPILDHAKFWVYANTPIPIPPHGDVVVKWSANVQTFNTAANPFPAAIIERNDYRFASGQFTAFDTVTGLNFAFVLTNNRVYIMYQSTSEFVNMSAKAVSAGFTFLIPVKIRRVCDWHDLEIVFHGDSKEVSYIVDGQEVFVINQVGYLLDRDYMVDDNGGAETLVWPASVFYGFGSFTDVDWYPACQRSESCRACRYPFIRQSLVELNDGTSFTEYNPIFGPPVAPVYYVISGPTSEYKLWGQGLITNIRRLLAYQRVPVC